MKKIVVIILMILIFLPIFALEVVGYGRTVEEARNQAISEIGKELYGNYIYSREMFKKDYISSEMEGELEVCLTSQGRIYGLEFEEKREGLRYRVKAYLREDENLKSFYETRIKVIENIIEGIFLSISQVEFNSSVYEAYLRTLLSYSAEYEACILILTYLGENPQISANYSQSMIFSLFN